jgi:predicted Fe-S protein YdhL (DUF1289 family)
MRIKKGILTPCRSICTMDLDLGLCLGCGRSSDDIKTWRSKSAEQREKRCAELANWDSSYGAALEIGAPL